MAFAILNFQAAGGQSKAGASPAKWAYKTEDTHATVDSSGYFNSMASALNVGDVITVVVVTDLGAAAEAVATYGTHIVLTIAAGVVDVSNVTVNVVTDSD